jgi:hypothetical protein
MNYGHKLLITVFLLCLAISANAQDSSKIYFTTSLGIFSPVAAFSRSYKNSLALNSGIEYRFSKHYFTQFVLDFNAVKYNQQVKDSNSSYLFQNTNSSIFLAGLTVGRNFSITKSGKLFLSPYVGFGYANIAEPRLTLKDAGGIIKQEVIRMRGVYVRQGLRLGYGTKSKVLQTLYIDASYLSVNATVQNSRPTAFTFLIGTRFGF